MTKNNSFISYLILTSFFMSGIYINTFGNVIFSQYAFMLFGVVAFSLKYKIIFIDRFLLKLFYIVFFLSLINIFISLDYYRLIYLLPKVSLLFLIICSVSILFYKRDYKTVFHMYINIAYVFSIFACFSAFIFFVSGFSISSIIPTITNKEYGAILGVAGLSAEPAFFATCLLPASIYSFFRLFLDNKFKFKFIIIFIAILLTTSSLAILSLFVAAIILVSLKIRRNIFVAFIIFPIIFFLFYFLFTSDFFMLRLLDTIDLLSDFNLNSYDGLNISTYAIGVNFDILINYIKDHFGVGYGFGLYSSVYDSYITNYEIPDYRDSIPGRGSAVSFFMRCTVELGIFGSILLILFLLLNRVSFTKNNAKMEHAIINWSLFCSLIAIYLRMGEYFINMIPVFIPLYFYSNRELHEK